MCCSQICNIHSELFRSVHVSMQVRYTFSDKENQMFYCLQHVLPFASQLIQTKLINILIQVHKLIKIIIIIFLKTKSRFRTKHGYCETKYLAELVQVPCSTPGSVKSKKDVNLPLIYKNLQFCFIQSQLLRSLQISTKV